MQVDLLMFDYGSSGFKRYAVGIVKEIKDKMPNAVVAAGYMVQDGNEDYPLIDYLFCVQDYRCSAVEVLSEYQPKAILLFAHRFFDYMFTVEAHRQNVCVYNFQHGIYMSNTVISAVSTHNILPLIRKKSEKVKLYSKCIFNMFGKQYFETVKVLLSLLRGQSVYQMLHEHFGSQCDADVSFIYGEYWKGYFEKQFGETNSRFVIVGYPELENAHREIDRCAFMDESKPVLGYLAQTSVEDGVINPEVLQSFLNKLAGCLDCSNLVMKFHPRNDRNLYATLLSHQTSGQVQVWAEKEFPIADIYIGHESTVLAQAMYITPKVLVCNLEEGRHSQFEQYTDYVLAPTEDLAAMVKKALSGTQKPKSGIKEYTLKNEKGGALRETAQEILAKIKTS